MSAPKSAIAPLDGITIVDLSLLIPGPWATTMLAELGAQVIHIEPPGGDPLRRTMPGSYDLVSRDKVVRELDLKSVAGLDQLQSIIATADVLVEGFRPGTADRLGFGPREMGSRHPRLIYCSINGYGSDGPYRDRPGHDINYLAASGVLSMSGDPDGRPYPGAGVPLADLSGSLFATQAILAALLLRERTGVGGYLEVPLAASALKISEPRLVEYEVLGRPTKTEMMSRGAYDTFRCRDGSWIAVGCIEDRFWSRLCTAIGCTDLLDDQRLTSYADRCAHSDLVNGRLSEIFAASDQAHWLDLLSTADVPVNAVADFAAVGDDIQMNRWLHGPPHQRRVSLPYDFRHFSETRGG
ncbi:CoA transferase [Microbacterium aerolatum]|uniref:CaiB/BaiF CoA transferase family protein n=1 Tax=Microbacterium aerolatum TaxID=153731 RepID=UPI002000D3DC|nr:CoA transferase [Microbacterium aerolatum]MCK3771127.1 CoA transferase [Microbacterium aerolatum]